MPVEFISRLESLPALTTEIQLVHMFQMTLEFVFSLEAKVTNDANKLPLLMVSLHVPGQSTLGEEPSMTGLTGIRQEMTVLVGDMTLVQQLRAEGSPTVFAVNVKSRSCSTKVSSFCVRYVVKIGLCKQTCQN